MIEKRKSANAYWLRSACPVNISLERFGDRWSLLLIRDMMVRGYKTFKEFQEAGEGIATNILSARLERLEKAGIVISAADDQDRRRVIYRLTEKGIDLAPVVLDLLIWATRWEQTGAPDDVVAQMERNRGAVIAEVRRRWREGDPVPFLPRFSQVQVPGAGRETSSLDGKKQRAKGVKR